jgi:hypothetical protein
MAKFKDFTRGQRFLLPPDLTDWVADDDLAHSVIAVVDMLSHLNPAVPFRFQGVSK